MKADVFSFLFKVRLTSIEGKGNQAHLCKAEMLDMALHLINVKKM